MVDVITINTGISHAYLVLDERPVLVDAGGPKAVAPILSALADHQIRVSDLAALVLTHGHTDHTGAAAHLASLGVPVVVGAADADMVRAGVNNDLRPTGPAAHLLKPFSMRMTTQPAEPTSLITGTRSLAEFGFDAEAEVVGGHTPGSLIVRFGHHAFLGDLVRGGFLSGRIKSGHPLQHYFQENLPEVHTALTHELQRNPELLYVGHGGPLTADALRAHVGKVAPA